MSIENIISFSDILFSLLGVVLGYFIKYFIDLKSEKASKVTAERREIYQNFISLILSLNTEKNKIDKEFKSKLNGFYSKYVLYASPRVIQALSEFIQLINSQKQEDIAEQCLPSLTKIMLEMRKDLGLSNRDLGKTGNKLLEAIVFE